jgi:nicotinate-nucleotide--dimethylbenzimidazole phosphoribosyltransferase
MLKGKPTNGVFMFSGLPFDDIRELVAGLPGADEGVENRERERSRLLAAAFGLPACHEEVIAWLAAWSGRTLSINRPMICLFAGTHSVLKDNAPAGESTLDGVTRMAAGRAPVNQVCAASDLGLKVFDLALSLPVGDITVEDALDEKSSAATIGFGMEAVSGGVDLLGLAAFGRHSQIGNAAIAHLLTGEDIDAFLPKECSDKFRKLCASTIERNSGLQDEPLELLRRLGGREHSALMGAILAARTQHVPVVIDGFSAICVAALLERLAAGSCSHCRLACHPTDPGTAALAETISLKPILIQGNSSALYEDGTGAALAIGKAKAFAMIHTGSQIDV